jgi:hypothetical protein
MYTHPEFALAQSKSRQAELIAEADRHRLLRLARERRHETRHAARVAATVATTAPVAAAPIAALVGTLATCGRDVAGSAR